MTRRYSTYPQAVCEIDGRDKTIETPNVELRGAAGVERVEHLASDCIDDVTRERRFCECDNPKGVR